MIRVGLTGGIGSGKTTVATIFQELGVPVFNTDLEARKFLENVDIRTKIIEVFGETVVSNQQINRKALAAIVFNNPTMLKLLNQLIHPKVRERIAEWFVENVNEPYVIVEAAILFENGFNELVDRVIVVTAPVEERIGRAVLRDNSTIERIRARINNQWPQEKLSQMADFVIDNADSVAILPQILKIDEILRGE